MSAPIDRGWRAEHPLPPIRSGSDKNTRGRVLLVGGSRLVPGGLRLTGEAALRAGASKLQIATIEPALMSFGVSFPEAGFIALPMDGQGEIAADAVEVLAEHVRRCDTLVIGPAMGPDGAAAALVRGLIEIPREDLAIVIDGAAIGAAADMAETIRAHGGRIVFTPHRGEMAALTRLERDEIDDAPERIAAETARAFGAVIALKDVATIIAGPDGATLGYESDCPGLGVAGSGDVLAGVIAALMARGAEPFTAAAWGVFLHGEAGLCCAREVGPIGFLARELPPQLPGLLAAHAAE